MNLEDVGFYVALKNGCYVFPEESLRIFIMKTMIYGKTMPKEADDNWIVYATNQSMKSLRTLCEEAQRQAGQRQDQQEH